MAGISLQMIDKSVSSHWWREVVKHFLRVGDALEIRCWKEEEEEIRLASAYGPLTWYTKLERRRRQQYWFFTLCKS